MEPQKIVTGASEDEVWQQLAPDFDESNNVLEYQALIDLAGRKIILDIDIDPGGGFESGYATTSFSSPISNENLSLHIYKQNLLAEAGKLFGLQDVETGYKEIDKRFIIKTNDEALVKRVFADYSVRNFFETNSGFELNTTTEKNGDEELKFLELTFEDGITNVESLRKIFSMFYLMLTAIDPIS